MLPTGLDPSHPQLTSSHHKQTKDPQTRFHKPQTPDPRPQTTNTSNIMFAITFRLFQAERQTSVNQPNSVPRHQSPLYDNIADRRRALARLRMSLEKWFMLVKEHPASADSSIEVEIQVVNSELMENLNKLNELVKELDRTPIEELGPDSPKALRIKVHLGEIELITEKKREQIEHGGARTWEWIDRDSPEEREEECWPESPYRPAPLPDWINRDFPEESQKDEEPQKDSEEDRRWTHCA
jgi:hypothetical protein